MGRLPEIFREIPEEAYRYAIDRSRTETSERGDVDPLDHAFGGPYK
jgi:hypothetical protein